MDNEQFLLELEKLRQSSTFLTIKGYCAENGEIADFNIIFHMSYKNALLKSINIVNNFKLTDLPISLQNDQLFDLAKQELLTSFSKSLDKIDNISLEDLDDGYIRFYDQNNDHVKGVKLHKNTGILHLFGLLVNKKIIMPTTYKHVNHKPLTVIKNQIKKSCPISKFRQFRITADQVESISVENLKINFAEAEF
jgi:hypothetical protein